MAKAKATSTQTIPTPDPSQGEGNKAVTFVSAWAFSVDLSTAGINRVVMFENGKLVTDDAEVIKALRDLIKQGKIVSVREVK